MDWQSQYLDSNPTKQFWNLVDFKYEKSKITSKETL